MSISHPLVCLGHALLDISAVVELSVFERYGLKQGNAILAEEKHLPLYKELTSGYQCDFVAGGSAQNTCRAAQWISRTPNFTAFFGCVGEDEYSIKLRESTSDAGVNVFYQVDRSLPTGTCAVLLLNKERSLVANLSAAQKISAEYIRENWNVIEHSQILYSEGYLLTSAADSVIESSKHACETGKIASVNLSAQFVVEFFKDQLMATWPHCEYIFGNEDEAQKFGEVFGLGTDLAEIVRKMSQMPSNTPRPQKIVISRGKDPVYVAIEGVLTEYPVRVIESEKILDLNGAGDSFVGGFLYEILRGNSIERAVAAGSYLAGEVIQLSGCSFPSEVNYH